MGLRNVLALVGLSTARLQWVEVIVVKDVHAIWSCSRILVSLSGFTDRISFLYPRWLVFLYPQSSSPCCHFYCFPASLYAPSKTEPSASAPVLYPRLRHRICKQSAHQASRFDRRIGARIETDPKVVVSAYITGVREVIGKHTIDPA